MDTFLQQNRFYGLKPLYVKNASVTTFHYCVKLVLFYSTHR
jgi:hypothetical protein